MPEILLLRLDAPLMSFGGPRVDDRGPTEPFIGLSALVGLLANALGYDHREAGRTQALQGRLRYGSREDQRPTSLLDFQTVDLGQPHLSQGGWTTRGSVEEREGGGARTGTHIRQQEYLAGGRFTVALRLEPAEEAPTLADLVDALRLPERPLFLGRKCCLPAALLFAGVVQAETLFDALRTAPLAPPTEATGDPPTCSVWWPVDEPPSDTSHSRLLEVTDERDWTNQIHVGRRLIRHARVRLEAPDA